VRGLSALVFPVVLGMGLAGLARAAAEEPRGGEGPTAAEIWLLPGAALCPIPLTKNCRRLEKIESVPVLERRPGWVRVRQRGQGVWVRRSDTARADGGPPLGEAPARLGPLPAQRADPQRLARARSLLGGAARELALGPYGLLTDVDDPPFLARLATLASDLDPAYATRFGVVPLGAPAETIVLFAQESSYRRFQAQETALGELPAAGYAGFGLVASYREPGSDTALEATLAHELTHLVTRRAIGPALPLWLAEGLAEDLGQARRDAEGRIELGTVGGEVTRAGRKMTYSGALAALDLLAAAYHEGRVPPLRQLVELDFEAFAAADSTAIHYAETLFFLRFLLDGAGGYAAGFRDFLAAVAHGAPATPQELEQHLGRPLAELDLPLRAWVVLKAAAEVPGFLAHAGAPSAGRARPEG